MTDNNIKANTSNLVRMTPLSVERINKTYLDNYSWYFNTDVWSCVHARIQGGGPRGPWPPPSPQNIAPPNSEARAKRALAPPPPGGQEGLGPPPYKILDPPMVFP